MLVSVEDENGDHIGDLTNMCQNEKNGLQPVQVRPCQPCQWGQQLGKLGTSRTAVDHTSEDYHCDYCGDREIL